MTNCYAVRRMLDFYPNVSADAARYHLNYSTFVNLDRRYMYFEVPKAGCTLIKTLIHRLEKLPPIDFMTSDMLELRRDMFIHDREKFKMPSLVSFDDTVQREILESKDFFRFTIVRNPYSRLVSAWRDKVRLCAPGYEYLYFKIKGSLPFGDDEQSFISFLEFIDHIANEDLQTCNSHWRLQSYHLCDQALDFSYIGRLEQLDQAVALFMDRAKFTEPANVQAMNGSVGTAHYDDRLAETVYRLYEKDFRAFHYDKDSWQASRPQGPTRESRSIPESKFVEELIERNIVICTLYATRRKLCQHINTISHAFQNLKTTHAELEKAHATLREAYAALQRDHEIGAEQLKKLKASLETRASNGSMVHYEIE